MITSFFYALFGLGELERKGKKKKIKFFKLSCLDKKRVKKKENLYFSSLEMSLKNLSNTLFIFIGGKYYI